jgi:hypothetical protein
MIAVYLDHSGIVPGRAIDDADMRRPLMHRAAECVTLTI